MAKKYAQIFKVTLKADSLCSYTGPSGIRPKQKYHCIYWMAQMSIYTVCPRSSDPSYLVTYYIKCVTTSWSDSKGQGYV